jgi:hypothetical protein
MAGFVSMWVSKWIFAWLFVDRSRIIESVRYQIGWRAGDEPGRGVTGTRLDAVTKNAIYWWDRPLAPLMLGATITVVGVCLGRHHSFGRTGRGLAWTAVGAAWIGVPVALWYVIANNHSQVHTWFTYRSVPVTIGASAALIVAASSVPRARADELGAALAGDRDRRSTPPDQ